MKKLLLLTVAVFTMIACAEKSTEDKVKDLIEANINKTVDNVEIGEKLNGMYINLDEYKMSVLDSTEFACRVTYTIKGIKEEISVVFDGNTYEPKELASVRFKKEQKHYWNYVDSMKKVDQEILDIVDLVADSLAADTGN